VIGTTLGPYRLEKELGNGGMGSVYLATVLEDAAGLKTGAKVAVKIVHPHLLERSGFFKRFMREAEIGRSVRHESVVRTLDVDAVSADGKMVHYMVMEYVEGRTLRELLDDLKTVPETLLREVARQVSSGLTAIHAAGIVHRDLKPENVLITPDHDVKVMDLGVARLMEQSVALTREGQFAGSLLYAAPEQFGNADVGPLADLYSVGVMLYELASGENPFQRDGAVAVMSAHLKDVPPRLSERNSEVSPFFGELVGTLLQKDPVERVESATALCELLEEGESSTWWGEREMLIRKEEGHLPKIPVRRETTLHGREECLTLLAEVWESARHGRGQVVLIEGEAGIGKTRVVDAFLQTLKGQDAHVLYGAYSPSGGSGGLTDALTARFGTDGMEEGLTPYLSVTPRLIPGFTALVQHEAPPAGAEPLTQDALHSCFVHLMKALAAEKPLLWVVDDLQFAQADSRRVVLSLARALETHRVLLLTTARPGLPEEEMVHFSRLPDFHKTGLARLGARDVIALLKDAFRSSILAERLGGKIAFKSDGVPYFVFEMIRGLKEGNFITEGPDGTYVETHIVSDIEVPSSIRDLIEARLKGLTRDERALLDVGAVQGMVFDPGLVGAVLEQKRMRVLQDLAEVERRTGLIRRDADGMRFDQNQVQEVLYRALLPDLRDEYHATLAEAFAEREGIDDTDAEDLESEEAIFLATHHLRGSRPRAGVPFLVPALQHLAKAHRRDEELDLAQRALTGKRLLKGAPRARVLLRLATCHTLQGRMEDAWGALQEARPLGAGDDALAVEVGLAVARFLASAARHPEAEAEYRRLLDAAVVTGDRQTEAAAAGGIGSALRNQGRMAGALTAFERALDIHREAGDREMEATVEGLAAFVHLSLGDSARALEFSARSLAFFEESGALAGQAAAHGTLGAVFNLVGGQSELQHVLRALAIHIDVGNRRGESAASLSIGNAYLALGQYDEARGSYERSLVLGRELSLRDLSAIADVNLGRLLSRLGEPDRAREHLETCLATCRETGNRRVEAYAFERLGTTEFRRGRTAEAGDLYDQALASRRELRYRLGIATTLLRLGRLRAHEGHEADARAHLEEAVATGREIHNVQTEVGALCRLAALEGTDVAEAAAALVAGGERVEFEERAESHWWLWKATGDTAHLAESWRALQHLRDHAPEEFRQTMIENVPVHRDIAAAAKEAGL
jgi:tetratricopeptide (TPR) repeat protein/predicted Ser/Thr protein kinase